MIAPATRRQVIMTRALPRAQPTMARGLLPAPGARLALVACLLVVAAGALAHKELPAVKRESSVPSKQNVTTTEASGQSTTSTTSTTTSTTATSAGPLPGSSTTEAASLASSTTTLGTAKAAPAAPANRRANSTAAETLEQQATGQSVSFAEPEARGAQTRQQPEHRHQHQQQQQQQQRQGHGLGQPKSSSGGGGGGGGANSVNSANSGTSFQNSNRWTHFGARLRPLATPALAAGADHQPAAANSKSLLVGYATGSPPRLNNQNSGNRLDAGDEEAEDEEQDSEALLYKMMQQQSFLLSPSWQAQAQAQSAGRRQTPNQASYANNGLANAQQPDNPSPDNGSGLEPSSRKVIKLLKSYSHIHQVDDSDDQIRGTYQPMAARRPPPARHNGNRQHIFVSSQPLTRAYSQNQAASGEQDNYNSGEPNSPGNEDAGNESSEQQNGPQSEEAEDFECPNNGIFADEPSGCQAYHVCQSGAQVQQRFQCPLGTLFNNIILTCDFAHNVQCGKGRAASSSQFPEGNQLDGPIHRQPAAQQEPRARGEQAPQRAGSNQQQQRPWVQHNQQQPAGPRPLNIGQSQYNRHQTGSSSRAQALNAYPSRAPHASGNAGNDDQAEDEQPEPLVPATLPPRPALAYNPPPRAQLPAQHQNQNYNRQQGYQQASSTPVYQPLTGGYDGASAVTPVFASRDESTTPIAAAAPAPQDVQLNLVINHNAPAVATPNRPAAAQASQRKPTVQAQQTQHHAKNHRQPAEPTGNNQRPVVVRQQQQAAAAGNAQRRPAETTARLPARPALVDLTGDNRKASGVSSEALNDGLLLVVRHDSGASPIKLAANQQPASHARKPAGSGASQQRARPQAAGQAFALDPAAVKPNSPLDAQLFPNVQRVIAAAHSQPAVSHQPAAGNQKQQQQANQSRQIASYASNQAQPRVAGPLPPMAPPRPVAEQADTNFASSSPATSQLEPLPVTPATAPSGAAHNNQRAQQKRIKRTRRLKASQLPKSQQPALGQQAAPVSTIESRTSVIVHSSSQQQVAPHHQNHHHHQNQ